MFVSSLSQTDVRRPLSSPRGRALNRGVIVDITVAWKAILVVNACCPYCVVIAGLEWLNCSAGFFEMDC